MKSLEDTLMDLVGRTIVEVGTEDDELMLAFDDGLVIWIHVEEEELMMTVSREEQVPQQ
jgi:hypothetical protein